MLTFIQSQFILYLTLAIVLFVPGIFLIIASRMHEEFSILEIFVLAFGSSFAVVDFLMILLGRTTLGITRTSLLGAIIIFCAVCWMIYRNYRRRHQITETIISQIPRHPITRRETFLIITLLFLTIFIKTIYFKDAIFPTTTDLGHHMYWTKEITTTGHLPDYAKADIGPDYTIGKPAPIADFIIGEHLPMAAIALISGAEFISAFPILTLFLVHIMSILAIFVLTQAFFRKSKHRGSVALIALFLIGPLWAISSPQAKFASGGVIGNNIGNLMIPITILLYLKALVLKKSNILAFALFMSLGLAYTHHLSTFVFIFLSLFTVAAYVVLNYKTVLADAREWMKIALAPSVFAVIAMGIIYILFLYTPTYLNTHAINTAVGAPSKASRAGLTFTQLKQTAGEARFAFAFLGVLLLLFLKKIGKYRQAFLIGWLGALTLMSLRPDWLLVDIPSNRIASYIVYPAAIIAAYMLARVFDFIKTGAKNFHYISPTFLIVTFVLIMSFVSTNGFFDNAISLNLGSDTTKPLETYAASGYLAKNSNTNDVILKDHNYIAGDSWIKLFFMNGYNYPLSRGYFKRYEDETKSREQCTNFMISNPNETDAQKCFAGTKTNFLMINPKYDAAQFQKSPEFWQVYSADDIAIFYKKS